MNLFFYTLSSSCPALSTPINTVMNTSTFQKGNLTMSDASGYEALLGSSAFMSGARCPSYEDQMTPAINNQAVSRLPRGSANRNRFDQTTWLTVAMGENETVQLAGSRMTSQ